MSKIDWKEQIGKRMALDGFNGTLRKWGHDENGEFWKVGKNSGKILRREPTLQPEWTPKEGEWVMVGNGWYVDKYGSPDFDLDFRPLTDAEIIDIGGGIDNLRRIMEKAGG